MSKEYKAPTNWRALCEELLGVWDAQPLPPYESSWASVIARARAALAAEADGPAVPESREPASVIGEPSDEVLLGIAAQSMNVYGGIRPGEYEEDNSCAIEVYGSELIAFARAALAHRGHQPEPIPLSERKPGPEDCNELNLCWFWLPDINGHEDLGEWQLQDRGWATDPDTDYTHWQPFHAISRPS